MFDNLSHNVILGWVSRRALEVGGWLTAVISFIVALPPDQQAVIIAILTGQGGALSVTAVIGLAGYLISQYLSYRATVKPQVVAPDKTKIPLTEEQARDAVEVATGRRPTGPVTRR